MILETNDKKFQEALHHLVADEPLKNSLLHHLSHPSEASLDAFKELWPNIEADRRESIIQKLAQITEDDFSVFFSPIFIFGLDDDSPGVQAASISGLWEVEDSIFIPIFSHLMKTGQSPAVREAAAQALGKYIYLGELEEVEEEAVLVAEQSLLEAIKEPQEEIDVVRRAVESLGYSSQKNVIDIIRWAYEQDDEMLQVSAMRAMGRNLNETWKDAVLEELDSDYDAMRFEAAYAAGELQMTEALDKLIALINDDLDAEVKANAVWALGQIGGPKAQRTLEDIIHAGIAPLSELAEGALEELMLNSGQLVDPLEALWGGAGKLEDEDVDDPADELDFPEGDYLSVPFKNTNENLN